jgi:hypothetical protein
MYEAVQRCTACGANLTLDDLRSPNCRYCGTVLPHRAQAEQHMQLMGQMMNQMVAQQAAIQDQWRANYGVGPIGPAGPMPPPGAPGSPYADPARLAAVQMQNVGRMSRMITMIVLAIVVGTFILVGVIMAIVMMRA